jgi:hypothetical protein
MQSGQKRSNLQVVYKESMAVKEINATEKKLSPLYWVSSKDVLKAPQELARSHPLQDLGHKIVN